MLLHGLTGFLCGLGGWTLLEYVIHRPFGHLPGGKTLIAREHTRHHQDILYFSPVPLKIRGAVPVLAILGGGAALALDPAFALGFVVAVASGWTAYEVLHQSIHVRGPRTWYGRWAAKNHLYHHFGRPNRNFGVTTPLWDFVFGTHDRVERVSLRERDLAAVPWLPDPKHLRDYEIRHAD
jgi:sterol desaturase/sphingolipid hydroxylase (fatty acid hydroxylase superfamily)